MASSPTITEPQLPAFSIEPIAGCIGAEVRGIDLRRPLSEPAFHVLQSALSEHLVLFFRDQPITPTQHRDFAMRFGPLQRHEAYPHAEGIPEVTVLEHTAEAPSKIEVWHTDMTFRARPPLGSILHGKIIPPRGGDTTWSNLQAAYEALSDSMQRFLDGLTAVHDFSYGFKESLAEPGGHERLAPMIAQNPPIEHPVVRRHPLSGKKGIFVNALFTTHIVGMKPRESQMLLNFLFDHCIQPEFTCRFRWKPDSIAFWDNRATLHKPINDHGSAHRKMQRVTVDDPFPVEGP